jgi:spore germination protein KA
VWPFEHRKRRRKKKGKDQRGQISHNESGPLFHDLKKNLDKIREELGHSTDLIVREFESDGERNIRFAAVYIDGLVDNNMVGDFIMKSLMLESRDDRQAVSPFDRVQENGLAVGEVKITRDWNGLILSILCGETVILMDGWDEAISCGTKGGETRPIDEPTSQVVIRGPRDSFTESIRTNTALVRRRIKSPNLWLETMRIGEVTQTDVSLMYIKGIVDEKLVREVKNRLERIQIDSILESGYIEEMIRDSALSPFPTLYMTERPDVIAGNLLEGRVAILVDGTPFALVVPALLNQFFQTTEDYYQNYWISGFLRFVRYGAFLLSLLTPSLYIAATTFHPAMIPTTFLITLVAQREGIPFPAFVEALIMELMFEILREAGIRLPRPVGQAVSIVGAIVLGDAAVRAGMVSPAMVIVVAITAIASFSAPSYNLAITARLLRFLFMLAAASFGLFGIALLLIVVLAHLSSLRSFGVPYLSPLAPFIFSDQKDTLFRFPWWSLVTRPRLISQKNMTRMEKDLRPSPPDKPTEGEGNEK